MTPDTSRLCLPSDSGSAPTLLLAERPGPRQPPSLLSVLPATKGRQAGPGRRPGSSKRTGLWTSGLLSFLGFPDSLRCWCHQIRCTWECHLLSPGPPAPEVLKQKIGSCPVRLSPLCTANCLSPSWALLDDAFLQQCADELADLLPLLGVHAACLPPSQTPRPQEDDGQGGIFHPGCSFG